jgi:hypothetical protein
MRPPRFNDYSVSIVEVPHVQLADGRAAQATVGDAVDDQPAGAANPFATIRIECDRFFALGDQPLVHHVEHFEERHVRIDVVGRIGFEMSARLGIFLAPDFEGEIHL